ncbi:hypothetical protein [Sphingobacterium wenxiniae]|nr:hypothetical protein [Sphingobacterium wenxiniae]
MEEIENKYSIEAPAAWAPQLSDEDILEKIKESDFSQQQYDDGKDFCYFLRKIEYTDDTQNAEYNCMAYSVQQPGTLEFASVNEYVLYTSERIVFHRIAVLRDGVLLDKLADTKFKVLDNENQSIDGVINSSKKVNITIKDVRLHDILIVEDTRVLTFTEKDFLRKELIKYMWFSPDVYWAYGSYEFDFVNQRTKPISYKKMFFRDEEGNLQPDETGTLAPGECYSMKLENFNNGVDVNREVYPFIDFATAHSYEELVDFVHPYYQTAVSTKPLAEYAADLVQKLDALEELETKIAFGIEYVQNNVRYIYNEEEMHGHRPQDPWVTFEFKQGDCKAKTVLMKCVLDYLGVDSEIILVNYNADFYLNYYLPSLFNFNHVILKINHNGNSYFEDATYRDEYGTLGNRSFISFLNYLPIKPQATLQQRESFTYPDFAIYDDILLDVKENVGYITVKTTYRYGRANSTRRYFKNTNKKAIVDNMNNFAFACLDMVEGENSSDKRQLFKNAEMNIVEDDKVNNIVVTEYKASVDSPYYVGTGGHKYLKFYDSNIVKQHLKDYVHKDITHWQVFDSEKYRVTIRTDKPIKMDDEYTNKQLNLDYQHFKYSLKKKVDKYGATADIEFIPLCNVEVPVAEVADLREKYAAVGKSAYGLGVSMAKPGLWDSIKGIFGGK